MPQVKIMMLRNPAKSFGCPLSEGETGPVSESLARQLIDLRLAVEVDPPKQIRGVPDIPKIVAEEAQPVAKDEPATATEPAAKGRPEKSKP